MNYGTLKVSLSSIIVFIILIFLLSSCGSTLYLKNYDGPRLPKSEVGVIKVGGNTGLCGVDNKSWKDMEIITNTSFPLREFVEVTPGRHGIYVAYIGEWQGPLRLKCQGPYFINVEAGHEYTMISHIEVVSSNYGKSYGHLYYTLHNGDGKGINIGIGN